MLTYFSCEFVQVEKFIEWLETASEESESEDDDDEDED